jgi:hypothetical protein
MQAANSVHHGSISQASSLFARVVEFVIADYGEDAYPSP